MFTKVSGKWVFAGIEESDEKVTEWEDIALTKIDDPTDRTTNYKVVTLEA